MKAILVVAESWPDPLAVVEAIAGLEEGAHVAMAPCSSQQDLVSLLSKTKGLASFTSYAAADSAELEATGSSKHAIPKRNAAMFRQEHRKGNAANIVMIFADDPQKDRNTRDCIERAKSAGIAITYFRPTGRNTETAAPTAVPEWVTLLYALTEEDASVDVVFDNTNRLLFAGRLSEFNDVLKAIDVDKLSITVALAFLSASLMPREYLSARPAFCDRVRAMLSKKCPDRVEGLLRGLA